MSYKEYDLHCHSTCSDGSFSPTEVVAKAQQQGIKHLALTDHDTTEGIAEATSAAETMGIKLISGVEISCEHQLSGGYGKNKEINKIIHVVGLDFDDVDKMNATLSKLQASRATRGLGMVEKLADILKLSNDEQTQLWHEVLSHADNNPEAVGRVHIARALLERGVIKNPQHAFDKYLGDNKPAYVKIDALTMKEGIDLIHACGGQAVLAHPTRYQLSSTRIRKLVTEFAELNGDASELSPLKEPISKRRMLDKVIADNNLLISIGSDFHGASSPWRKLGDVSRPTKEQVGVWERFR